jgi:hypothetical protein
MRGADAYNEALFSTVRLEDFVPAKHPLRPIRQWVYDALSKMDARFSAVHEADVKGGRPSIAPEKLVRAMLLQVLYSVRRASRASHLPGQPQVRHQGHLPLLQLRQVRATLLRRVPVQIQPPGRLRNDAQIAGRGSDKGSACAA